MALSSYRKRLKWPSAGLLCAFSVAFLVAAPGAASAGFFDFLFGGQQSAPSPGVSAYAEPTAPSTRLPADLGAVQPASSGRAVAFCVRLCDGRHFPLEHAANATPVETCRSLCPAAKTQVFFGSAIDGAVAHDGARYADLDNAFVYRQRLVPNCTCNGKDAVGLATPDAATDPTLRPGDIVATATGLMAYAGKRGQTAAFTPVDRATVNAELNAAPARPRFARRSTAPHVADEEPGVIVPARAEIATSGRPQWAR